eukprot:6560012-Ditylum_brightwellii.AAC.1
MSPRLARTKALLEKKRLKKLKASQEEQSKEDGKGGRVMSAIETSSRKKEMGLQFPGLAVSNLRGAVPLDDDFYEHDKNDPGNGGVGKKRSRWDSKPSAGQPEDGRKGVETSQRKQSNLPAWMTKNKESKDTNSAGNAVESSKRRGVSNLPSWMTKEGTSQADEGPVSKRPKGDDEITLHQICRGKVQNIMDFGVFVELDNANSGRYQQHQRKKEGMVHISQVAKGKINHPSDAGIRKGDAVWVKVISISGGSGGDRKIMLSLKDVDQKTGRDLMPYRARAS